MNEWNIQSRAHACQACQKPFADKELYHTLLFEEKQELRRQDVCKPCWEAQFSQFKAGQEGFISYWHGIYIAPPATPPDPIQRETAETLMRKLIEANDPKHGPACFILAVMMERKRLLKVKEQIKQGGTRIFIYEHPKTGDIYTITDPNLQLNQLEEVQRDVGHLLEHGLTPPPGAEPVPASPAEAASAPPAEAAPEAPVSEPAANTDAPAPAPDQTAVPAQAAAPVSAETPEPQT